MSLRWPPHHKPPPLFHPMMAQGFMAWPTAVVSVLHSVSTTGSGGTPGVSDTKCQVVLAHMMSR